MTVTEAEVAALAEALREHHGPGYFPGTECVCVIGSLEDCARAILASLPDGWRFTDAECIEGTLEVTEDDLSCTPDERALLDALARLPSDKPWTLASIPGACYAVSVYSDGTEATRLGADADTLTAAIVAALGDER
jgi:hypothetical protein